MFKLEHCIERTRYSITITFACPVVTSRTLATMFEKISAGNYALNSVHIFRYGYHVEDSYRYSFNQEKPHFIHSCTKSIVSGLFGINDGYLNSVGTPILSIINGRHITNLNSDKESISIEDLLTMTAGLEYHDSFLYQSAGIHPVRRNRDWIQYML